MHQLPHAAGEAVADLTERVGMSQLTKRHVDDQRPAGDSHVARHSPSCKRASRAKRVAWDFVKQLTEQTGGLYHAILLRIA